MLRTALSRASPDAGLGFARRRSLRRPAAAGTTGWDMEAFVGDKVCSRAGARG